MRKNYLFYSCIYWFLVQFFLLLSGCNSQEVIIESDSEFKIQKVTTEYLQSPEFIQDIFGSTTLVNKTFCAYQVYGLETKNGKYYQYLWTVCQEYDLKNKKLEAKTGISLPIAMTIEKEDEFYQVVDYQIPRSGEHYREDLKEIFPADIVIKFNFPPNNFNDSHYLVSRLEKETLQAAKVYFQVR